MMRRKLCSPEEIANKLCAANDLIHRLAIRFQIDGGLLGPYNSFYFAMRLKWVWRYGTRLIRNHGSTASLPLSCFRRTF